MKKRATFTEDLLRLPQIESFILTCVSAKRHKKLEDGAVIVGNRFGYAFFKTAASHDANWKESSGLGFYVEKSM